MVSLGGILFVLSGSSEELARGNNSSSRVDAKLARDGRVT
jgi:hypothetical protein